MQNIYAKVEGKNAAFSEKYPFILYKKKSNFPFYIVWV